MDEHVWLDGWQPEILSVGHLAKTDVTSSSFTSPRKVIWSWLLGPAEVGVVCDGGIGSRV